MSRPTPQAIDFKPRPEVDPLDALTGAATQPATQSPVAPRAKAPKSPKSPKEPAVRVTGFIPLDVHRRLNEELCRRRNAGGPVRGRADISALVTEALDAFLPKA